MELVRRGSISPTQVRRQLEHDIQQVRGQALVRAARAESLGYVAAVGMMQVAGLTALEAQLIKSHPLGEPRYQAIVDTATAAIALEISGMVWG